jgi:integrase/recombinase XerD
MQTTKVFLNRKGIKKNGECAIYCTVHIENKTMKFNTGVTAKPENFAENVMRLKGTSKKVKDDNLIIEKCLAQLNDIFVRYRLQNIELTAELLKNEWKNPARRIDFFVFFDEVFDERKKDLRPQSRKNQLSDINKLKKFKNPLAFAEINTDFLEKYRRWLKKEMNNDINTVFSAFKTLKTYTNIAIKKGVISENPFANFRAKKAKPERVFLTNSEFTKMWNLYCDNKLTPPKQRDLRHFLFMCFTGCRISDFKRLTKFNISENMLVFVPEKTSGIKKEIVKIPISNFARQLMSDENSQDDYIFHPISEQKLNDSIKEIAKMVKIFKPISNHSARHTFATLWLEKTNDLAALQKLLGHSDIADTMIYVHITDKMLKSQMSKFDKSIFD